jgi:hypothetical protein
MSCGEKAVIEAFCRQEIEIMNQESNLSSSSPTRMRKIDNITDEDLEKMYGKRPDDFDTATYVEKSGSFLNELNKF